MAIVPTPEECARAILAVFGAQRLRAGSTLMSGHIGMRFLDAGYQATDYDAGMKYAEKQGWIEAENQSQIRLTEVGFAEM